MTPRAANDVNFYLCTIDHRQMTQSIEASLRCVLLSSIYLGHSLRSNRGFKLSPHVKQLHKGGIPGPVVMGGDSEFKRSRVRLSVPYAHLFAVNIVVLLD